MKAPGWQSQAPARGRSGAAMRFKRHRAAPREATRALAPAAAAARRRARRASAAARGRPRHHRGHAGRAQQHRRPSLRGHSRRPVGQVVEVRLESADRRASCRGAENAAGEGSGVRGGQRIHETVPRPLKGAKARRLRASQGIARQVRLRRGNLEGTIVPGLRVAARLPRPGGAPVRAPKRPTHAAARRDGRASAEGLGDPLRRRKARRPRGPRRRARGRARARATAAWSRRRTSRPSGRHGAWRPRARCRRGG